MVGAAERVQGRISHGFNRIFRLGGGAKALLAHFARYPLQQLQITPSIPCKILLMGLQYMASPNKP